MRAFEMRVLRYLLLGEMGLATLGALAGGVIARVVLASFAVGLAANVAILARDEHKERRP